VEKHVSEIFARLGVNGDLRVSRRVRAALLYLESGRESERVEG
jgi:DNA-binding NarL/FixJ family response regulator